MSIEISPILDRIRAEKPLILNITNEVSADFVANGLLSLGAAPVMSKAVQEAEALVKLAAAVIINPGTLNEDFIHLSTTICQAANHYNKPIILDPVGAGATPYRTLHAARLLEQFQIAIVRGNASEIMALCHANTTTKGVESTALSTAAIASAEILARQHRVAVLISGQTDIIVDCHRSEQFTRGSALMPQVTGTGCLLSAVVGAFHAVESDSFKAATAAAFFYALCGEYAEQQATGPGSFRMHFIDALAMPSPFYKDK